MTTKRRVIDLRAMRAKRAKSTSSHKQELFGTFGTLDLPPGFITRRRNGTVTILLAKDDCQRVIAMLLTGLKHIERAPDDIGIAIQVKT